MKVPAAQVLAVEDDAVIALEMQRLMQPAGVEITLASSGEKALETVRQRRFDLIMLNLRLSGISGLEVCRRLKLDPDLKDIPVVFLSAETNSQFMNIAFRLGAVDYLTKPYEVEHFKTRMLVHLGHLPKGAGDADRRRRRVLQKI